MENEKTDIYNIKDIILDVFVDEDEIDPDKFVEMTEKFHKNLRRGNNYYQAYKNMECVTDLINGVDYNTYREDKDMVVRNIKKIFENDNYLTFVNKSKRDDFTFVKFLELMEDKENREIFKDLYLNGLYYLDHDYYNITDEDVDRYIKDADYDESVKSYHKMIENFEILVASTLTIKDKVNRRIIIDELEEAMKKPAIRAMDFINRENFLNRIIKIIPEFRFITRVEDLPSEIFLEYVKHNGFETLGEITYDENGFPKDKITDEMVVEIVDNYYKTLEQRNKEHKQDIREIMDQLIVRL